MTESKTQLATLSENQDEIQAMPPTVDWGVIGNILMKGDIAGLTPQQQVDYLRQLCAALHLNPLLQPFAIVNFKGKTVLYATRNCTDQLSTHHKISRQRLTPQHDTSRGVYIETVTATLPSGRSHTDIGAVPLAANTTGEPAAIAMMKALTKANRRAVIGLCGLGMIDESELETVAVTVRPPAEGGATPEPEPEPVARATDAAKREFLAWIGEWRTRQEVDETALDDRAWAVAVTGGHKLETIADIESLRQRIRNAEFDAFTGELVADKETAPPAQSKEVASA